MRYQPTECILSEDELRERCAEWQETLRLQDWTVAVRVVRALEFGRMDAEGHCLWTETRRSAHIRILDHADHDTDSTTPHDMEATLVHELLHLHFVPFDEPTGEPKQVAQEQAIHALSCALVALKRAAQARSEVAEAALAHHAALKAYAAREGDRERLAVDLDAATDGLNDACERARYAAVAE